MVPSVKQCNWGLSLWANQSLIQNLKGYMWPETFQRNQNQFPYISQPKPNLNTNRITLSSTWCNPTRQNSHLVIIQCGSRQGRVMWESRLEANLTFCSFAHEFGFYKGCWRLHLMRWPPWIHVIFWYCKNDLAWYLYPLLVK